MSEDFTTREDVRAVYQKQYRVYEFAVYCCYLLGFPIGHYRRLVIKALDPRLPNAPTAMTLSQSDIASHFRWFDLPVKQLNTVMFAGVVALINGVILINWE